MAFKLENTDLIKYSGQVSFQEISVYILIFNEVASGHAFFSLYRRAYLSPILNQIYDVLPEGVQTYGLQTQERLEICRYLDFTIGSQVFPFNRIEGGPN